MFGKLKKSLIGSEKKERTIDLGKEFNALAKTLARAQNILLVVHPKPDADALGAAFSLAEFIKERAKKLERFEIFSVDRPVSGLDQIFPTEEISTSKKTIKHPEEFDRIVFVDRGDVFFKFGFDEKIKKLDQDLPQPEIINIDHHLETSISGALNVINTRAAATCEIIFHFLESQNFSLDSRLAQFLLSGIYGDTGGFRHRNTTAETLEVVSRLMKKGASVSRANRIIFSGKSLSALRLWSVALERAKVDPKTGMVASFITKEDLEKCGSTAEDISGISEILSTIADSKFSLVLTEVAQNKIKASLRSDEHKGVDVAEIARKFRGGGHTLASGFEIKGRLKKQGDEWVIE